MTTQENIADIGLTAETIQQLSVTSELHEIRQHALRILVKSADVQRAKAMGMVGVYAPDSEKGESS